MSQTPQTCLDPSDNDGYVFICLPDQIGIYDGRIVRPLSHDAARGIGVRCPPFSGNRIVVDHGIHIASHDQKSKPRFSESGYTVFIPPVRL